MRIEGASEDSIQVALTIRVAWCGWQSGDRPRGPFVTIDGRCKDRGPRATHKNKRRLRDGCRARDRERLGREPYQLTGHLNAAFSIAQENLPILDGRIELGRNEAERRASMPLFSRRGR